MVNKKKAANGFSAAYLILVLLLIYSPILLLVATSFSSARIIGEEGTLSLIWYEQLFRSERVVRILINTVVLAVVAAVLSTVLGTTGAIGVFYSKKSTATVLQTANQIPVVNAEIVTALSLAILFSACAFPRSYFSLLVGHLVLCTPFVFISVMPKLQQMDNNLYEAALDLGATPTQALFKVVIPQIAGGIVSGFMLSVTLSLDDYIITAFTKPKTFDTISTYVYNAVKNESQSDLPLIRALSAIVFAIMIVIVVVMVVRSEKSKEER